MTKQNFENIKNYVLKHKGISIQNLNDDNFTLPNYRTGYFVSLNAYEYQTSEFSYESFNEFILKHESLLKTIPLLIGVWYYKKKKTYFYDLSMYISNKDSAIRMGIKNNQTSIFEIETGNSIILKDLNMIDKLAAIYYE
jgi:hypothetical protein